MIHTQRLNPRQPVLSSSIHVVSIPSHPIHLSIESQNQPHTHAITPNPKNRHFFHIHLPTSTLVTVVLTKIPSMPTPRPTGLSGLPSLLAFPLALSFRSFFSLSLSSSIFLCASIASFHLCSPAFAPASYAGSPVPNPIPCPPLPLRLAPLLSLSEPSSVAGVVASMGRGLVGEAVCASVHAGLGRAARSLASASSATGFDVFQAGLALRGSISISMTRPALGDSDLRFSVLVPSDSIFSIELPLMLVSLLLPIVVVVVFPPFGTFRLPRFRSIPVPMPLWSIFERRSPPPRGVALLREKKWPRPTAVVVPYARFEVDFAPAEPKYDDADERRNLNNGRQVGMQAARIPSAHSAVLMVEMVE